jgi:Ca-activated chloride channel homolog
MNRTHLIVATAALLALGAAVVGPLRAPPRPPSVVTPGAPPPRSVTAGPLTLEGRLSSAWLRAGPDESYATFTVRAHPTAAARRQPVSLALVIDRSGSMRGPKLQDAKQAARGLVRGLGPEDRLALVHYGSDVNVLPGEAVTPEARERMLAFVDAIEDEGATHLSGGLEAGIRALEPTGEGFRSRRVILLSDGEPTDGITEEQPLWRLADDARRQGITVSTLGVGEEFNERLLRGLTEHGGGFYGYLQDSERLTAILQRERDQAAGALARGVELRLELPEDVTDAQVLGLSSRREGSTLWVPLYDLAGGQQARVVVRLTHHLEATDAERPVLRASLSFQDLEARRPVELTLPVLARVTGDEALVQAHLDSEVQVATSRARGAHELQAAAEAMNQGERARALELLDQARSLFGASASALAGEMHEVERTAAAYRNAHDETSVRREALKLHTKSLECFGQSNTY